MEAGVGTRNTYLKRTPARAPTSQSPGHREGSLVKDSEGPEGVMARVTMSPQAAGGAGCCSIAGDAEFGDAEAAAGAADAEAGLTWESGAHTTARSRCRRRSGTWKTGRRAQYGRLL